MVPFRQVGASQNPLAATRLIGCHVCVMCHDNHNNDNKLYLNLEQEREESNRCILCEKKTWETLNKFIKKNHIT